MARPLTPLGSLGARVATALEQSAAERAHAISDARQHYLALALHPPKQQGHALRTLAISMAAALAALAAMAWLVLVRPLRPLQFSVDGEVGVAQTWLAASRGRSMALHFSDGTNLRIDPSSRARVVDIDRHGANIALESGVIHADVVHTRSSAWRLNAGPFTIRVIGTRFDLRWDSVVERFSISVREGSVGVAGSIVGAERPVRAGETLTVSVADGRLDWMEGSSAAFEASGQQQAALQNVRAESRETDAASTALPSRPSASEAAPTVAVWRELAKNGDLRRAFAAADAGGFRSACATATAAELLLLGDAARLAERPERAAEALLALRRRYPHDSRRAAAAFALGKVAFDERRAYREASEWFSTSVREQPSGPLAREAAGREIESLRNAGDAEGARRAARQYLSRYPDGPHAGLARALAISSGPDSLKSERLTEPHHSN